MAETIKDYLVSLGFKIKDPEKFSSAVEGAEKQVKKTSSEADKSVKGMAAGIGDSLALSGLKFEAFKAVATDMARAVRTIVGNVAAEFEKLGYTAERTGASVAGLRQLSMAAEQAGTSAGGVSAAIESLGDKMKSFPAMGSWFRDQLGIGNADGMKTEDLFFRIGAALRNMSTQRQRMYGNFLGIDTTTLNALTSGRLEAAQKQVSALYTAAGIDAEEAKKSSTEFMQSLRWTQDSLHVLWESVSISVNKKMSPLFRQFQENAIHHFKEISDHVASGVEEALRLFGSFSTLGGQMLRWGRDFDEVTGGWAHKVLIAIAAWKLLNSVFRASPLGRLILIGTAVAALAQDYLAWKNGLKSGLDWSAWDGPIQKTIATVRTLWHWIDRLTGGRAEANKGPILAISAALLMFLGPLRLIRMAWKALFSGGRTMLHLGRGAINLIKLFRYGGEYLWLVGKAALSGARGFSTLRQAVVVALRVFAGGGRILMLLGRILLGLLGPWGMVIALAVAAGIAIYENWDTVKTWFHDFCEWLKEKFPETWDAVKSVGEWCSTKISEAWETVKGWFRSFVTWLPDSFSRMGEGVAKVFSDLADWLSAHFFGWFEKKWDVVRRALHLAGDWAGEKVEEAGRVIGGGILPSAAAAEAPSDSILRTGAGSGKPLTSLEQQSRFAQAVAFLESKGLSHAQAVGWAANIQRESGFNAAARGDGEKAVGLEQWHPDRQRAIAAGTGIDVRSAGFEEQLEAAWWEATRGQEQKNFQKFLQDSATPGRSAAAFSRYIERPANTVGEQIGRGQIAEDYEARFAARLAPSPAAQAALRSSVSNDNRRSVVFNQTNTTTVNGATDPQGTADAIGFHQDIANRKLRNAQGGAS
jgi:hypothetical protein